MQPINAPSVRNYNNIGTRNNGFQYKLMPLSFNLQQKGNSHISLYTDIRHEFNIGDIVQGLCLYDQKEHIGYITQIIYDEKTNNPISVYIIDYKTKFNLPLNYSTLEKVYKSNIYESFNFDKTINKINKSFKYIKGLFNDIYDIDNENNSSVEIADYITTQNIGDIIYKHNRPFAICCGLADDFSDNTPRYLLLNNKGYDIWSEQLKIVPKLKPVYSDNTIIKIKTDIINVDDNGYKNTQIIKNNTNIDYYPAFRYCANVNINAYLPAINELEYLVYYINDIINILNKDKRKYKNIIKYLEDIKTYKRVSSSSYTSTHTYYIMDFKTKEVTEKLKDSFAFIIPFVKI